MAHSTGTVRSLLYVFLGPSVNLQRCKIRSTTKRAYCTLSTPTSIIIRFGMKRCFGQEKCVEAFFSKHHSPAQHYFFGQSKCFSDLLQCSIVFLPIWPLVAAGFTSNAQDAEELTFLVNRQHVFSDKSTSE